MYKLTKTDLNSISEYKKKYYNNLTAPMDDFWEEGLIPSCDFYLINDIGYYAVDSEGVLTQFYTDKSCNFNKVFTEVVKQKNIKKAYVSTYDPLFYKACKSISNDFSENTYLYEENIKHNPISLEDGIDIYIAKDSDLERAIEYNTFNLGEAGTWLKDYYTKLISKRGLYFFIKNNEILGTGETRKSISSKNIMNIGVTVSSNHRRKGLATYIINTMREISNKQGYKTICSTTIDNIGSQKTLSKCGYELYHKIYTVNF